MEKIYVCTTKSSRKKVLKFSLCSLCLVLEFGTQKEGEVCGSCFNPDTNFDCGKCIQGLQCIKDPQSDLLPDLPSKCGVASSIGNK